MNSSSIYPWPRKIFVPNDDSLSDNSGTNIVHNKIKARYETVYQNDYSNGEGTHVVFDTTANLQPTEQLVKCYF